MVLALQYTMPFKVTQFKTAFSTSHMELIAHV